jgi:hypothetical protein
MFTTNTDAGVTYLWERKEMGSLRFELKTSAVSRRRHNQLDHEPAIASFLTFTIVCKQSIKSLLFW